ncbi:hypothetical protein FACS189431_1770 [Alphaproteobacteria bacterium]|nr:hypothetical protein FACS189431_1770 [Alphaproteobacteria bacterium]
MSKQPLNQRPEKPGRTLKVIIVCICFVVLLIYMGGILFPEFALWLDNSLLILLILLVLVVMSVVEIINAHRQNRKAALSAKIALIITAPLTLAILYTFLYQLIRTTTIIM